MDGNFTGWVNVGECSVTCGGGRQYQRRNCTNPMPAHGGDNCTGNTSRTISCNVEPCPGIQTKELVLRWFIKILHIAAKLWHFSFLYFNFQLLLKTFVSTLWHIFSSCLENFVAYIERCWFIQKILMYFCSPEKKIQYIK